MSDRKHYYVPDPDDLTLGQAQFIYKVTGVDVFNPPSFAHLIAAMLVYAGRGDGLTLAAALEYKATDYTLAGDEDPNDEGDVDPLDPDHVDELNDTEGPTSGSDVDVTS